MYFEVSLVVVVVVTPSSHSSSLSSPSSSPSSLSSCCHGICHGRHIIIVAGCGVGSLLSSMTQVVGWSGGWRSHHRSLSSLSPLSGRVVVVGSLPPSCPSSCPSPLSSLSPSSSCPCRAGWWWGCRRRRHACCHAPNTFGTVNMECTVDSRLSWSER